MLSESSCAFYLVYLNWICLVTQTQNIFSRSSSFVNVNYSFFCPKLETHEAHICFVSTMIVLALLLFLLLCSLNRAIICLAPTAILMSAASIQRFIGEILTSNILLPLNFISLGNGIYLSLTDTCSFSGDSTAHFHNVRDVILYHFTATGDWNLNSDFNLWWGNCRMFCRYIRNMLFIKFTFISVITTDHKEELKNMFKCRKYLIF